MSAVLRFCFYLIRGLVDNSYCHGISSEIIRQSASKWCLGRTRRSSSASSTYSPPVQFYYLCVAKLTLRNQFNQEEYTGIENNGCTNVRVNQFLFSFELTSECSHTYRNIHTKLHPNKHYYASLLVQFPIKQTTAYDPTFCAVLTIWWIRLK